MGELEKTVYKSIINLHRKTNKEWLHLKEIYEEVSKTRPLVNGGASIRATIEKHCALSKAFSGEEQYILKEKGTGLYKSINYDRLTLIRNLNIGDVITHNQMMNMFKISGQQGIMPSNTLNCIVLMMSDSNEVYENSLVLNGVLQYTGQGQSGNQKLSGNNKTLYYSKKEEKPIYLFAKNYKREYVFRGQVELYDDPYQVSEKERLVWKFPLKVMSETVKSKKKRIEDITYKIIKISEQLEEQIEINNLIFKEGKLNIREYRKDKDKKKNTNKTDYITAEIVKTIQGEINERVIYEKEIERLAEQDATEQIALMKDFFLNKKGNEEYDILSFELDEDGNFVEKYIEVKSTKGPESTPIDITDNEIRFAKDNIDNYYLYRIIKSNSKNRYVKVVKGKELFEDFRLIPTAYKIYK